VHIGLGGGPEGRTPLGRTRHKWDNNFKVEHRDRMG